MGKNTPKPKQSPLSGKEGKPRIPDSTGRNQRFSGYRDYLLVGMLSLLVYSNTLFFGFALDDGLFITDNKLTRKGLSGIPEILTRDAFYGVFGEQAAVLLPGGRYRPLSQIVFAVVYQFFGLSPFAGHLINILLYALLCMLLLKVLKQLFEDTCHKEWYQNIPLLATLVFALHPLHTEVVANIKGLDEILSFGFSLLTLWFSLQWVNNQKIKFLAGSFAAFMLALLAKENSVTFLAVVPLTLYFFRKPDIKKYILILSPLVLALFVYIALRINALGFLSNKVVNQELLNDPFIGSTAADKMATLLLTWGKYLILLIFPHPLTHDYYPKQIPVIGLTDLRAIFSLIVILALLVFSVVWFRKKHILSYCILFFAITFSVSSNLVFNIGTFMNERFMFVPLTGFAIAIAYLSSGFMKHARMRSILKILLIILMTGYAIRTFSRNFAWRDTFTLYTTDVRTSANSAKCNVGAGEMLVKSIKPGMPPSEKAEILNKAIVYLRKGVEIYPGFTTGWLYLGYALHELKAYEDARIALGEVLRQDPRNRDAVNYLNYDALECYKLGNLKQSENNFRTIVKYTPDKQEYLYLLAEVYVNSGVVDSGMMILQDMVMQYPEFDKSYNKLGEVYGRVFGDMKKSFEYLLKAYSLNPRNIETLRNLGTAYGLTGDFNNSLRYLKEAETLAPSDRDILTKIALTYQNMGEKALSESYAARAQQIAEP